VETESGDRVDEVMRAERERWARIEAAKTPEDLARALHDEPPEEPAAEQPAPVERPRSSSGFTPTIVSVAIGVTVILLWLLWIQSALPDAP